MTLVANNSGHRGWGSGLEGSSLIKRGNYYYLIVNNGGCCSGVNSTYEMRMGRSTSPTGPFLDKNGIDLRDGGGSIFLEDNGKFIGPGHFARFTDTDGTDYFGMHYYNGDFNGAPNYWKQQLFWTSDNWPNAYAVNPDWKGTAGSNWSQALNWSNSTVPNGVGHVATFDSTLTGNAQINLDSSKTVGSINFFGFTNFTVNSAAGAVLTLDATNADQATINASAGTQTITAAINASDWLGVNVSSNGRVNLNGAVNARGMTKYGHGTLALNGTTAFSEPVLMKWGFVEINGAVTSNGFISIGQFANENSTLIVRANGSLTANGEVNVGDSGNINDPATGTLGIYDAASVTVNAGGSLFIGSGYYANTKANGTLNQAGGTLTVNGGGDGRFVIGGRNSARATGTYNLSGGTVNAVTNVQVGGFGTGTMNQVGGLFNANAWLSIARRPGSVGVWNLSAGSLNHTNASTSIIVGEEGNGTLNVSGSGQIATVGSLRLGHVSGATGKVNLNGGTIATPAITQGAGTGEFNFNGGTLKATQSNSTFILGLTRANVQTGGAKIDTNGFNVVIGQALLGGAGDGGLIKLGNGRLTLTEKNTYTGTTVVSGGELRATSLAYAVLLTNNGGVNVGSTLSLDYTGTSSPVATVKSILSSGYSNGFTTGQIRSTALTGNRTIGYGDNSSNLVTIRVTLAGDADLDGDVDFNDFLALQNKFGQSGTRFDQGDFNYDGKTDFNDFLALQNNFGQSVSVAPSGVTASQVAALAAFAASYSVPEPASIGLLGLAAIGLVRRRRGTV